MLASRPDPATAGDTPPATRRDAAFALCLAVVLTFGVLAVLLLNTWMQQQSERIAEQRRAVAELSTQLQSLETTLDLAADPNRLAARAQALRLRPADDVRYVRRGRVLSGPTPATGRGRAG